MQALRYTLHGNMPVAPKSRNLIVVGLLPSDAIELQFPKKANYRAELKAPAETYDISNLPEHLRLTRVQALRYGLHWQHASGTQIEESDRGWSTAVRLIGLD